MTWPEEVGVFLKAARGDLAILVGLCALRRTENGGPGRELGVLSVSAPTLADQARVAARSFKNHERRVLVHIRDEHTWLYTPEFLEAFSHRWAPLGAENDPHGLNRHHAENLKSFYQRYAGRVLRALQVEV